MAGQTVGKVDVTYQFSTDNENNQALFTTIWRFFNGPMLSSSYVELVALNYGAAGTGTEYPDENAPFGQNAFFVWRLPSGSSSRPVDVYVMCQWADATSFGSSPGNPGRLSNGTGDGVGICVAYRDDGGNPWAGSTNGDGSDTKGDPVWTAGDSVLRIFPRSNEDGLTHSTSKENLFQISDVSSSDDINQKIHMVADRDNFVLLHDENNNQDYENFFFYGLYTPIDALTGSIDMPFMCYGDDGTSLGISTNVSYGSSVGSSTKDGILQAAPGSTNTTGSIFRFDRYGFMFNDTNLHPNTLLSPSQFVSYPLALVVYDTPDFGHVGYIEFFQELSQAPNHSVNAASSSVVFGTGTPRFVMPWSGSAPLTVTTRDGREWAV